MLWLINWFIMNKMEIFLNAQVITLDPTQPSATALVVENGRIIALGDDRAIRATYLESKVTHSSPGVSVLDMQGRTILPGLTDAHFHLEHYALSLQKVNCETSTLQGCLDRVSERAQKSRPGEWVLGHGWNQNNWLLGFGSAADLDRAAPDNPVYLTAKSLHAGWANSAALRLAGITEETPDPSDGRLGRAPDGRLNGILFESAMDLVAKAIPEASLDQVVEAIGSAQSSLWSMGITGVHDFDRRRCFIALQRLREQGMLKLRVIKSIPLEDLDHAIALGLRSGFGDDWIRIGGIKAFADGALGPQTAAMLQPYENVRSNRGMLFLDAEELFEHGRKAVEGGFSLAVHAIGDRANHEVLSAFEQLRGLEAEKFYRGDRAQANQFGLRHRIEHVQVIHPDDVAKLAQLGVVASMQPLHATSDMQMADRYWGGRVELAYAWRAQLDHGAILAFGSDAPVESPNPFLGLHAAVTRQRTDGTPGTQGWVPDQRISILQALEAYTLGPARTAGTQSCSGKLAAGFLADIIVLNQNPLSCLPEQIHTIQPVGTMVGGEWVYREF
ncbi:MAG: amidohydrolase [Anaerolineales bacterium]|nr:amidohydrolase [Anaerolineales bacterium]